LIDPNISKINLYYNKHNIIISTPLLEDKKLNIALIILTSVNKNLFIPKSSKINILTMILFLLSNKKLINLKQPVDS